VYTVIGYFTLTSQLCTHEYASRYCHFGIYKCMHTAGRSTMHAMSWSGFSRSCRCMHDEHAACVRAWWAARPEAASAGTPLGQDGRPSTRAISGPRRPQGRSTHVWASARAGAACWLNSRLPARISQNLAGDLSIGSHTKQVPLSDKLAVKNIK
jgi:hypothetical protein